MFNKTSLSLLQTPSVVVGQHIFAVTRASMYNFANLSSPTGMQHTLLEMPRMNMSQSFALASVQNRYILISGGYYINLDQNETKKQRQVSDSALMFDTVTHGWI